MKLGQADIGAGRRPFIVAEISGNHAQSLDTAIRLVEGAWEAGASAVKLQTFVPELMTLDSDLPAYQANPAGPWKGQKLIDLYRRSALSFEAQRRLFAHCARKEILLFSAPFDVPSVEFLESVHNPIYKIASFELVHLPLIRRVAATGKPMIVSTGMATVAEITEAVDAIRAAGVRELVLLKCTSSYPAPPAESNLAAIPKLRELFGCEVGLSDHTLGIGAAVAAVALGASVIEKHVTLDRAADGIDAAFSLELPEFAALVAEANRAAQSLGSAAIGPSAAEAAARERRRSLFVVADVRKGEAFTQANVGVLRPALGLAPKHLDEVLRRRAARDMPAGTPLAWEDCA
ncbi:MAG TPA: pseudaminic acid synthase [Burkholderiales bacterium]|nr:pseudaminic acid synthase [Burkholderiales bacterium]